ncbi:HlyD family efflux transporter periplasmic adaptor subunit [Chamaesiphon sp. VAR_69_metabat_338]|uniref:HlyD family efflux transporter periplasmic adaptor subunit n=1 Tax=Chamaesiphon sp. VAR_69_metabat_338 TaxID=2964704 RepID=UPI00286DC128|nr:HlyD family efflux transporter periplasmic adaptor subunit [Chamaesiphon sp. VAR_69_metabat_338]
MKLLNQSSEDKRNTANKLAKRKIAPDGLRQAEPTQLDTYQVGEIEQSVVFQQSRAWSRGIVWTILAITTGLITWACLAPIEEAITITGKLEPTEKVKDVQVPVGGVVKTVFVKEGDKVTAGQKLLRLESTVPQTTLASLQKNLDSMTAETRFYHSLLDRGVDTVNPQDLAKLNVRPEILALTKNRSAILAETQLYRSELNGTDVANLNPEQRQRLQSSRAETASRTSSAQLEVGQVDNQMRENLGKRKGLSELLVDNKAVIANINAKTAAKRSQIAAQMAENRTQYQSAQSLAASNSEILSSLKPAGEAGALSRNQVLKQEQEVTSRQSEVAQLDDRYRKLQQDEQELIANSRLEIQNQQQQIKKNQQEIAQLSREYNRLTMATNQSREKLKNSVATSQKDILTRIAANDKQVAEIDGQLNKTIVEIDRKVADLTSQISQAKMNLKYQEIVAPASGTVFELKAGTPGFVATTSEPILKIVPNNNLNAKVFISNKDIGFVKAGMPVDVRIDSFPFSEFGDVKGTVLAIGSDALAADQAHPYERFPAIVQLAKQQISIKGKPVTLQSGMSLSANVKLRNRTVMSIFTDAIVKQNDAMKTVR